MKTAKDYLLDIGFDEAHLPELFNDDDKSVYTVPELMDGFAEDKELWTSLNDRLPEFKDCDFVEGLIVTDGKTVWDDVSIKRSSDHFWKEDKSSTYSYEFWKHYLGYDMDQFQIHNITHWMLLPEPPKH